jgi:hypothetical protein
MALGLLFHGALVALDLAVAGMSLAVALGLFAVLATVLCSAAFIHHSRPTTTATCGYIPHKHTLHVCFLESFLAARAMRIASVLGCVLELLSLVNFSCGAEQCAFSNVSQLIM